MKKNLLLIVLVFAGSAIIAQSAALLASYRATNQTLGTVLEGLEEQYAVRFSYSPDYIPLQRKVSVDDQGEGLNGVLEDICRQLPISYRIVGRQVMLKPSRITKQLGQIRAITPKVEQQSPIYPEPGVNEAERKRLSRQMAPIRPPRAKEVINGPGGDNYREINFDLYRLPMTGEISLGAWPQEEIHTGDRRLAQISILPYVGTNLERSDEITNHVSLNVLWGTNGGVDGVEVGGFFNKVVNDVQGVQIAGLGSQVGGNVSGTQVGGIFNINAGKVQGVQAAGLFNISGEAEAIQAAGLFNISKGDMTGMQASGLFNVSKGRADGLQVASLFNRSQGFTRSQVAGLYNWAGDVKGGQVSSLLNIARDVDGFQVGLVNIADTVNGVSVGLLNIIKNGYNRFELSANDALFANAALKLGGYAFYNVFRAGLRWDKQPASSVSISLAGGSAGTTAYTWGLGYGMGTTKRLSPQLMMNVEAVCMHINEREPWTRDLNLLNQLSLTLGYNAEERQTRFFAGPVANLMVSRLVNAETGELGSGAIAPNYTLAEGDVGQTNLRFWIGVQGGVRF